MGEGAVDFRKYIQLLKVLNIDKPISLHAEYDLGGAEHGAKKLSISPEIVKATLKRDLTRLKALLV